MVWAIVSSRSCFCWLYRASPSSAAKNIIYLISVLTIWWCPCVKLSRVIGIGCLLWPACSLYKTLLALALLPFVLQGQTCLLLQVSLDFLLLHSSPLWWKGHFFFFFLVLGLESVVGLHRTSQFQLLWHQWLGHRLRLLWCWMVCFRNEPRSFSHFWDCTQVLHFEGYYISSKGLFPTVDIMVIWIKFSHSHPFYFTNT